MLKCFGVKFLHVNLSLSVILFVLSVHYANLWGVLGTKCTCVSINTVEITPQCFNKKESRKGKIENK